MGADEKQIHGHAVMDMMMAADKPYTRETLRADIVARFGEDALFYTCSASGLSVDGLIDFLAAHGKFSGGSEAFRIDPASRCADDE
jgi:probable metal-binding protein